MRIAEVIGTVTLSQCHPTFVGATLKLVTPLTLAELQSGAPGKADTIVAWEEQGAATGDKIALSEGGEAAQPFRPHDKPVDAYSAALLDQIQF